MVDFSRRTLMSAFGLAPLSSFGAETFVPPSSDGSTPSSNQITKEQMAGALHKLASMIDSGEVLIEALDIHGAIRPQDIVRHQLVVTFLYKG